MTEQVERELAEMFAARAARVDVPPVPAALLDAEPRRPRRRRAVAAGLVAAAVVAAVVGVGLAQRRDDPRPAHPPDGPHGLEVPYLLDGALHVGTRTLPTRGNQLVVTGDQVLVARAEENAGGITWQRLAGDRLVALPYLDGAWSVQVSYDGTRIAAPVTAGATTSLRLWDTADAAVVDTIPLSRRPAAEDSWLWGFDDRGRLFWQDGATQRMRNVAGAEVTVRLGDRHFGGLTPGGVVLVDGFSSRTADLAAVTDDGAVEKTGEVPVSAIARWRDRDTLAYQQLASGLVDVYDVPSGRRVPIDLGAGVSGTPVGWSGDELVVLAQGLDAQRVVAVDPATGDLRVLLQLGWGEEPVFPIVGGTGAM